MNETSPSPVRSEPASTRATIRRKPGRARYDAAAIHAAVDAALVCHIAFMDEGSVHSLPMLGWRVGDHLYIHAARNSRIGDALQRTECSVSVAVVDGLVLARSAFRHSMNYRSAVIYGCFEPVDDPATQRTIYAALVDRLVPGRSARVREPSAAELAGTALLRLSLVEGAAKQRQGGPEDNREDLDRPVWAGVIPLALCAAAAQAQPECSTLPVPEIAAFLKGDA